MTHFHHDLPDAGPVPENALRVTPLGGLGDVGRNMTVFEYADRLLIVDCGVLFPEEHHPGVDLILPDFESIRDRLDRVEALVLTHGHEDHIGATPYLLRERGDIPLVGSKLTLALLRSKLQEHRLKETVQHQVVEGDPISFGPFELEFVAVNHSIPDALAVAIRTPAGMVLHTGDFKMDQLPLDGRITDLRAFARLGEEGVDLFMVDSTNAEVPGFTTSEGEIGPVIDRVFQRSQGRIIVACFASHVHRVQQVLDAAVAHKRKVAYVGRSMIRNMNVARELGYLNVPADTLVDSKEIDKFAPERTVLISTGSQGEPLSALSRIAQRTHNFVHLEEGDTVVLASSLIPGNENAVYRVINGLSRWGAHVVHKGNALVHVSGHASAGRAPLLLQHRPAAQRAAGARRDPAPAGQRGAGPGDRHLLRARRGRRGRHGHRPDGRQDRGRRQGAGAATSTSTGSRSATSPRCCSRTVASSARRASSPSSSWSTWARGRCSAAPEIHARGFAEDDSVFDQIKQPIVDALTAAMAEGTDDTYQLQQTVRRVIGRWVSGKHRRRPMIIPVVVEA